MKNNRPPASPSSLVAACAAFAAAIAPAAAWSQTGGPGQLERQFATPPALPSGQGPVIPETPNQQPPADAENVRFTLTRIDFVGNAVYPGEQLRGRVTGLIGREITLAELFRFADALTQTLRNDGYVLSRVIVPPQSIRDGAVQLRVVEGYIAQTNLRGSTSGPRETLDAHLAAIRASRPLAASVLERELLLMNDLPGVEARSTIGPSATPGASDLTVDVSERRFAAAAGLNNRGSKSLGPWRADLSVEGYQLLGGYDRGSARLIQTVSGNELTFLSAGYERALGSNGARLALNGSYVDSTPGTTQNFELPTNSSSLGLQFSIPALRSRTQSVRIRAGLGHLRSETEIDSGGTTLPLSDDRITAFRFGANVEAVDEFRGLSVLDVELSKGLAAFGASREGDPNLSVSDGKPGFLKVNLYAARLQSIVPPWSVLIAASAQYSSDVLLAPERFGFGGELFGRAYDAAEITGDSGAALKIEVRYAGTTAMAALRDYTVYAFWEGGTVRRRGASVASGQRARESATDFGIGLRFSAQRTWSGYLEITKPLTHDVAQQGDRDPRAFVGVQASF